MSQTSAHQPGATTQPSGRPQGATGPAIQRQFVNFACYKLDPEFRRLPAGDKDHARQEFVGLFAEPRQGLGV